MSTGGAVTFTWKETGFHHVCAHGILAVWLLSVATVNDRIAVYKERNVAVTERIVFYHRKVAIAKRAFVAESIGNHRARMHRRERNIVVVWILTSKKLYIA